MEFMPDEKAAWPRESPARLSTQQVAEIFARALPGHPAVSFDPLPGGLSNAMYRVRVAGLSEPLVLRLYSRDAAACRKEVEIHRLVAGRVPVPEILYADCAGEAETPPHVVMRWVEGVTFRQIKQRANIGEIAECARAIGTVLAHIGAFTFERPGVLGSGLAIGEPLCDSIPAFVETCLATAEFNRRMPCGDRARLHEFIWRWAPELSSLNGDHSLVHSDFGAPNLLLRETGGRRQVVAVLDWEFAFSGSPLCDVGHMMRYERLRRPRIEPHFSTAFRDHGGILPPNWSELSRVLDLTALCEFLTRPTLPEQVVPEIRELILATIENRDACT